MQDRTKYAAIIIGGSYAGLSAALTLGRSMRNTLIIDGGKPCNRQTPHSHNFLTQDGEKPQLIAQKAKEQVLKYDTVRYQHGEVIEVVKNESDFTVRTTDGLVLRANKILFATGVKDLLPSIKGFADCWGISVLHCPYCHGYEVRNKKTGILANGETALEMCQLIRHWTDQLTLFTNGPADLTTAQRSAISALNIEIVEQEITELDHREGYLQKVKFVDGSQALVDALYARAPFEQHCPIPLHLGCELTEHGHIQVDFLQKTTVDGIYAAGDNTSFFRTVSIATAAGTKAGAAINKELIEEGGSY